jgi:hypothetical protein
MLMMLSYNFLLQQNKRRKKPHGPQGRRMQKVNFDYFQFEITIRPNTSKVAGSCTAGDLASIGQAIDQAIQSLTFPEDIPGQSSKFVAGLCTTQKVVPPTLRSRSRFLQGSPGWVWNGGGGRCAQCPPDNGDRISIFPSENNGTETTAKTSSLLGNNVFLKGATLIKKVELLLVFIVLNDVVPYFPCLGKKPTVDVKVIGVDATKLSLGCNGGVPPSMGIQAVLNTLP